MPLVDQAIEATSSYGDQHEVRFDLDETAPGTRVEVDPDRFIQVLTNVLSNAVRFSSAGDVVKVSVNRHAGCLRVAVADCGPGIPEKVRRRLFRPFATSREDGNGNGLGLFIVRQTVRKLGGQIRMTTSSEGTTFWIDLPRATPCPEPSARET